MAAPQLRDWLYKFVGARKAGCLKAARRRSAHGQSAANQAPEGF